MPPASSQPPPRRQRPLRTPGDPVSPFDAAARDYDDWFDGEGKLIFETELRALEQVLAGLPRPWLEVGSGSHAVQTGEIRAQMPPPGQFHRLAR